MSDDAMDGRKLVMFCPACGSKWYSGPNGRGITPQWGAKYRACRESPISAPPPAPSPSST